MGSKARQVVGGAVGRAKRFKRRMKQRFHLFDPLQILPFRGHGTPDRLFLSGRLLEREGVIYDTDDAASSADPIRSENGRIANWRASIRRLRSDEIPGARLEVRFGELRREVLTDEEGYFHHELELRDPVEAGWQEVQLRLLESIAGSEGVHARARVLVPDEDCDFGIISDIDDTVIKTGATNRLRMIRNVIFKDARTREPFPGVADFYKALQAGPDGLGENPIFYLSRSGWNLYDLFDAALELHQVPRGPMFLTDLSVVEPKSTALGGAEDKRTRIEHLLATYPSMRFVLIGDSGQEDPEIYAEIVQRHPGRIRAVYLRDVTGHRRDAEVRRLVLQIRDAGVPARAVATTAEAAFDAAELGLIPGSTAGEVRAASEALRDQPPA